MRIVKIKLYFDKIKAGTILSVKFTTREAFESNDVGGWVDANEGGGYDNDSGRYTTETAGTLSLLFLSFRFAD